MSSGVHLYVLPPLLHDLLRHRPGGQLPVVRPLGDHVHAVVLAEQLPFGGVMPRQVAGAASVGLCGLAGLAEIFDEGFALFHLERVLRLLQGRAEGAQLGGQSAVQRVHHAALPLLEPLDALFPAQAHCLRQAPPFKGCIVRPLGVAVIQQPLQLFPQKMLRVRPAGQVHHLGRVRVLVDVAQQQDLERRVLRVPVGTHGFDVLRRVGLDIHRDDRFHGNLLS